MPIRDLKTGARLLTPEAKIAPALAGLRLSLARKWSKRARLLTFVAVAALTQLISPGRANASAEQDLVNQAERFLTQGNYESAYFCSMRAAKEFPKSSEALRLFGWLTLQKGDIKTASTLLNKAVELDPKNYAAMTAHAELLQDQKHYDEAREELTRAIKLEPSNPIAYYLRGIVCLLQGMHIRGEQDLTQAIELGKGHPQVAFAYYWRGRCKEMMDRQKEAIPDLSKAIELASGVAPTGVQKRNKAFIQLYMMTPRDGQTRLGVLERGLCYMRVGDFPNAIKDLNEVLKANPKDSLLLEQRGTAYLRCREYRKALTDFNQSLLNGSQSSEIFLKLGLTRYALKTYDRAIRDLSTWVSKSLWNEDETALAVGLVKRCYRLNGQNSAATAYIKKAREELAKKKTRNFDLVKLFTGETKPAQIQADYKSLSPKERAMTDYCIGLYFLSQNSRPSAQPYFKRASDANIDEPILSIGTDIELHREISTNSKQR